MTEAVKEKVPNKTINPEFDMSQLFDLVSYQDIDDYHGYWLTEDGDFSVFMILPGIDETSLNNEHLSNVSAALNRCFLKLPGGVSGQLMKLTHKDIRSKLTAYHQGTASGGLEQLIIDSVVNRQVEAANSKHGFFSKIDKSWLIDAEQNVVDELGGSKVYLKKHDPLPATGRFAHTSQLVLNLRFRPTIKSQDILPGVSKLKYYLGVVDKKVAAAEVYLKARERFIESVDDFVKALNDYNFGARVLSADGVVDILYRFLNPQRVYSSQAPAYKTGHTLMEALGFIPTHRRKTVAEHAGFSKVTMTMSGMEIEHHNSPTYYYRVTSGGVLPRRTPPNLFSEYLHGLEGECALVINFQIKSDWESQKAYMTKAASLFVQRRLAESLPFVDTSKYELYEQDMAYYRTITSPDNLETRERDCEISIHYIAAGTDKDEVLHRAVSAENKLNGSGRLETKRANTVLHSCIPGNFKGSKMESIARSQSYPSGVLADLAPLYVKYQGFNSSAIMVNNRDGNPITLDLFDGVKTPHSLVVGGTGTGKTFFFINLLLQMIAKQKPKIFIVDRSYGYRPLVNLFSGAFVDLSLEDQSPTKLNLFNTYQDRESKLPRVATAIEQISIVAALKSFIRSINPDRKFSALESNLLTDAVQNYMEDVKPVEKQGTLSEFITILEDITLDDLADGKTLALELKQYYGRGHYAKMFDGESDFDWDSDLICFETSRMPSEVMPAVMLLLFSTIDSYAKSRLPRSRKKILAIEEAWSALAVEGMISVIAGFYREMRKYGMGIVLVSQTITEFIKLIKMEASAGDSDGILANVANFFLLPVSDADYSMAQSDLGFSDDEVSAWKSLRAAPPFYTEVFHRYRMENDTFGCGIFRLYSNPVGLWIATSKGDGFEKREALIAEYIESGLSKVEATTKAIDELSRKHPFGSEYRAAA